MAVSSTTDASPPLELIATAAAGTEAVVKRELAALGYAARTVTPGRLLFPGDPGIPARLTNSDLNNFAPRLGVAWDVNGSAKTVVRGGYGIFYQQINGETTHAAEAPWRGTTQLRQGRVEDPSVPPIELV